MNGMDKRRVLSAIILVGFVCIVMVVMTAYAAELRCENNDLIAANKALQGEVDTLDVKIKTTSSVEHIEKVAKSKLGMEYPTSDNFVYLKDSDTPQKNFAAVIRSEAYN